MIDLKDDEQRYKYLEKCISGKPIDFHGLYIYQPEVGEIFEMGQELYFRILFPFILPRESFEDIPFEEYKKNVQLLSNFITSTTFFMRLEENDIKYKRDDRNIVKKLWVKNIEITNELFCEMKEVIQFICNVRELKKEDLEPRNKTDEEKKFKEDKDNERFSKLFKSRRESKAKIDKKVQLINVYDYVVHAQGNIDYEKPLRWTIYQLYNTYQNLHIKDNVNFIHDIASNGMLDKKEKIKNLSEEIAK